MGAPAKFLFDTDFAAPAATKERAATAAEIAQQLAEAEARGYRAGFDAGRFEAKAESDRRAALALEEIGISINAIASRFSTVEDRMETEAVDVALAVARKLCAGLPVEIRLQDYRELDEPFDAAFSIGMFEHVGDRNYRTYFEVVQRCLPPHALFLLHTIGRNVSTHHTDPWIARYIFPNSMLPSAAQVASASEGLFVIEDWHNFGTDYDRTLQAWRTNIEAAWPRLDARYDERFRRMWRFYLAGAMASFRTRRAQLWQLVLSPRGVPGGYLAPR